MGDNLLQTRYPAVKTPNTSMQIRLGKVACPRVNDDQKIDVDDHKFNSGRPHDNWILENLFYDILLIFAIFLLLCRRNSHEDDHKCLWTTSL